MASDPIAPKSIDPISFSSSAPVPSDIQSRIRNSWVAAATVGTVMLVFPFLAVVGTPLLGFTVLELIDVTFVFGMAFGIYKGRRLCAVTMLIYFIVVGYIKIHLAIEADMIGNWGYAVAGICSIYIFQGVIGTYQYQKLLRLRKAGASVRA